MSFKKDDMVLHIPSGCVVRYISKYKGLLCCSVPQFIPIVDCRPYVDPQGVIEAARALPKEGRLAMDCRMIAVRKALAAYDAADGVK